MGFSSYLKELGRGAEGSRSLSKAEARGLYTKILNGEVPDLELGALLLALRMKGESREEMAGFLTALESDVRVLRAPETKPVILPSYNGARKGANLTPLLALLLKRLGIPVVIHGLLEDFGRVTSGDILSELGVSPVQTLPEAQLGIDAGEVVFVPIDLLSPGVATQLSLRARLGLRNAAHSLVKMLDPFTGQSVVLAAATHPSYIGMMREIMAERGQSALLCRGTEGEPFANPRRCPQIEMIQKGKTTLLVEAERESIRILPDLPEAIDAAATAQWIRRVMDSELPIPRPLLWQLVGCLILSGQCVTAAEAISCMDSKLMLDGEVVKAMQLEARHEVI